MADETQAEVTHGAVTASSNYDDEAAIRAALEAPVTADPGPTAPDTVEELEPQVPTRPEGDTVPEPAPEVAAAENDEADEAKPDRLYFRDGEGKFRRAGSKEVKHALQRRVDTLTAQRHAESAELARWRAEARGRGAVETTSRPTAPARPVLASFSQEPDPYAAWMEALAESKADEKLNAYKAEQALAADDQVAGSINREFHDRQEDFESEHPDYQQLVRESDLKTSPLMSALFTTHDRGPEFMYYLGHHPEVCLDLALATMSTPITENTLEALDRRLSLRVEAAPISTGTPASLAPVRTTTRPIRPVRTGRPADTDRPPGDEASMEEHRRYHNQQEREARRRP